MKELRMLAAAVADAFDADDLDEAARRANEYFDMRGQLGVPAGFDIRSVPLPGGHA